MICHKIGRIINGDANYEDSWRDIAGYAQLVADRLLEPGKEEKKEKRGSSDLEFIKLLDSKIQSLESDLEKIRKGKPIGDREISEHEKYLVAKIIGYKMYRDELIQKAEKVSSESVKQTQGETLKYSAPKPVLRILPILPEEWKYHNVTLRRSK